MPRKPSLLKACVLCAISALNEHAPLRRFVLGAVLLLSLLCVGLAAFGIRLEGKLHMAYSPRMLALVFLPAELYLYDLCLGAAPRTGTAMALDMRLPRLLWATLRLGLLMAAATAACFLPAAIVFPLVKGGSLTGAKAAVLIGTLLVGWLAAMALLGVYAVRAMFLPVIVALRAPKPLTTLYRITKGRTWVLTKALFWPWTALVVLSAVMQWLGSALENRLGFVALAPWFVADACLSALACCTTAVLLALTYRSHLAADAPAGEKPAPQPEARA
jgi:hypothetical protein